MLKSSSRSLTLLLLFEAEYQYKMSRKAATAAVVGQRRRSPRISALDSCKKRHDKGQPKRRNLDSAVSKLAKQVWRGRDSPADCVTTEWRSQKHDTVITNGNSNGRVSVMPAKHTLELVLDTLQRRDTYEIFAQPVDPDEVEDYYEIIKEPMDFGTMRAKLHEGMYQNLEQFEHDVFLIPENAMHFNSSSTTYFRQARAIHELATKVFHVLKTNPENFASEFSGARRSMRKALRDDSVAKSGACPSTSARKGPAAFHFNDSGDSRVADGRDAYLSKREDHPQTFYNSSSRAQLVLMNRGETSYEDSLMCYVKDLGPTAQMVAKRKLLGCCESSNAKRNSCGGGGGVAAKEFKTFRDFALTGGGNPFLKTVIDLTEETKLRHYSRRKDKAAPAPAPTPEPAPAAPAAAVTKNRNPVSMVRDVNSSSRPVILALENPHSQLSKSRNKKSNCLLSKEPSRPVIFDEASKQQHKPLPLISHFTFDLPFLKARLEQMKAVDTRGLKRKGSLSLA